MIASKKTRTSLLLSLYIDDRLDGLQRRQIEERIAREPHVRREYEELLSMRRLLAAQEPLAKNPFLPERIMNYIATGSEAQEAFLPVPRRLMPAAVGTITLVLIALVAFAWIQREQILRYIGDTGSQMQLAYEDTILKGWIMPLFQRTDRDQVLQFAMFGTLPLDGTDGPLLRVDENAERGYRVELAGNMSKGQPATTIDELYSEIRPTPVQRKIFDTLFLYAQRQIESAVLMNEAKQIAIDPSISKYNQVILSGIAASLEPDQLDRFEEFLEKRNTPYTFVTHRSTSPPTPPPPPPPPAKLLERFRTVRTADEYVVLNDDSFTITRLHLDMDSLRRLMKIVEQRMPRLEVRVQDIARSYAVSRQSGAPDPPATPQGIRVMPVEISEGGHAISISIDSGGEIMRELEQEFEDLKHEVVIFRRQNADLREQLPQIQRDRLRATVRTGRSQHLTVTLRQDSASRFSVEIDSSTEDGGAVPGDIDIDLQDLLETAPKGGVLEWRELIPEEERMRVDSLLRGGGIEYLLPKKDVEKLRKAPVPMQPRHIPPAKPPTPPSQKDTVIEI
ncbi:MAG: hypothetical protein IH600_11040 [Bacteroidetes bacterium]|nr:hypothetical protein [Bacteroidota bacterium]